jgi:hypothetical protein
MQRSAVWGNRYTSGTGPAEIVARAVSDRDALLAELVEYARESDD